MNNDSIIRVNTPAILASFFLLSFFYAKVIDMPTMISNGLIAGMGIVCFLYCLIKGKFSTKHVLLCSGLSLCMLVSILYNGNASYLELLWCWCFVGVAGILAYFPISSQTVTGVFIIVSITFAAMIIGGVDPQEGLASQSGNMISVIILFYVFLIYIKRYEEKKKIIFWPCLLAILFSVWGNGRSGLLSSVLLFVLIFLYGYFFVEKKKISTLLKVLVLVAIGLFLLDHYFGAYIELFESKLDKYGSSSVRTEIWAEYIDQASASIGPLLFGVPTEYGSGNGTLLATYTLHNSFVSLHAEYGLVGFLYVACSLLIFVRKFWIRKEYLYLIVIFVWFIRSMFDWIGFPGIFDVIFFYFLLKSGEENTVTAQ